MSWFTSVGETNLGNVRCELGKTMGVLGFPNVSSLGMFVEHFRSLGLRSCLREVFSDLIFVVFQHHVGGKILGSLSFPTTYSMDLHSYRLPHRQEPLTWFYQPHYTRFHESAQKWPTMKLYLEYLGSRFHG